MDLQNEFERQGNWLFRWRSYLPVAMIPLIASAVLVMHWPWGSYAIHEVLEFFCLAVSLAGLAVRAAAIGYAPAGTSGRNTKTQLAETLNTTGVYSLLRHPLYLGNYLIGLGALLVPGVWWLPVIYTLSFWLYYERIMMAEEAFLKARFGEAFSAWAVQTPAFIPNFSLWRPPALSFSLVNVLKREYTALALIVVLHAAIEAAEHWVIEGRLKFEPVWIALLTVGLGSYVVLRALKRHSQLLHVDGR